MEGGKPSAASSRPSKSPDKVIRPLSKRQSPLDSRTTSYLGPRSSRTQMVDGETSLHDGKLSNGSQITTIPFTVYHINLHEIILKC